MDTAETSNPWQGTTNVWYHIVFTRNAGSTKAVYIDGVLIGSASDGGASVALPALKIYNTNSYVDEFAIWNSALSSSEIAALYNSGSGLVASSNSGNYTSASNLQGYWQFNEGTGSTVVDASSNSNTATLSGASWSTTDGITLGGTTSKLVNYSSGSNLSTLTFNYTVASGDNSNDLDYSNNTALSLNGGRLKILQAMMLP